MPHRDDFEAALARIAALEHELETARGRIAELERRKIEEPDAEVDDDDDDPETVALAAKLRAFSPIERARFLVDEAERAATTQPLRAVVAIARRFVDGNATRAELEAAGSEAAAILHSAYEAVHAAQVARVQSLDELARAASVSRDTSALKVALDAPNSTTALSEQAANASVVLHVLMAIDPELEFLDLARVLARR